jgi:hypothetical protein
MTSGAALEGRHAREVVIENTHSALATRSVVFFSGEVPKRSSQTRPAESQGPMTNVLSVDIHSKASSADSVALTVRRLPNEEHTTGGNNFTELCADRLAPPAIGV